VASQYVTEGVTLVTDM